MNLKDLAERVLWTFVQAFTGALAAGPVLGIDMSVLEAAAMAGLGAVVALVTVVARQRLTDLDAADRP